MEEGKEMQAARRLLNMILNKLSDFKFGNLGLGNHKYLLIDMGGRLLLLGLSVAIACSKTRLNP